MTIEDFKIPGTKMPDLTKCTYKVLHWKNTADVGKDLGLGRVSYGYVLDNGIHYILVEFLDYKGTDYFMVPVDEVEKLAIEQGMIKETKKLPKSFACKNTNQKLWDKYINWLNNLNGDEVTYNGKVPDNYYGITPSETFDSSSFGGTFDTILSLEEWNEIVNGKQIKEEVMEKTHSITRSQLEEIHNVACRAWRDTIVKYANRNPFGNIINFTQKEIDAMFAASNNIQMPVLESIFGKQSKDIDLSTGTVDGKTLFDNNGRPNDGLICLRNYGDYKNKAFLLNDDYNWELVKDSGEHQCLIPTRK